MANREWKRRATGADTEERTFHSLFAIRHSLPEGVLRGGVDAFGFEGDAAGGPVRGVADDAEDRRVVVGGMRLVAGAEVDDAAVTAPPRAEGAEHLAALEPGDHERLVGGGDVEPLAVHLLVGQLDALADAVE